MVRNEMCLVFNHIPKTAGTSIRKMIIDAVGQENTLKVPWCKPNQIAEQYESIKLLSKDKKDRIRLLYGHQPFGTFYKALEKPCIHFSLLRDPLKRALSHLNMDLKHICGKKFSPKVVHEYVRHQKYNYEKFGSYIDDFYVYCNLQTRWLSNNIFGTPYDDGQSMLNAALTNSEKSVIFMTDEMDNIREFIRAFYQMERPPATAFENKASYQTAVEDLPEDVLNFIMDRKQLDYELCRYVKMKNQRMSDKILY